MTSFVNIARAAALSLLLAGGSGLVAAPVQAQGFGFGFSIGDDDDDGMFRRFPGARLCILTDRQLRQTIADQGYGNIALNVRNDRIMHARATRGNWVYQLTINACTGTVLDRERLRRAR